MVTDKVVAEDNKKNVEQQDPVDFETAIATSGFGIFNVLLLLVAVLAFGATVFETTTVSYILPSAECDLQLTLLDKGILNAITYAGMITSAVVWGYIADTKGRKRLLMLGYLLDGICVVGAASSQNVVQLMIFKYFGGFVVCGPFAVLTTYISELHGKQYRARVMMLSGVIFSIAQLVLPVMAITILPQKWDFHIIGLTFHSWQIFLAISSIPSFISSLSLSLFPESPKFLMSQGRNQEALKVFQSIYAMNKLKPKDTYPHKALIEEVPEKYKKICTVATIESTENDLKTRRDSAVHAFKDGLAQMLPLLRKPYLKLSLLVYLMNFCILLGQNTMRLWLPQLFASIKEFQVTSNETPSMCAIVEYSVNKTAMVQDSPCVVVITAASYTNNIIVSLSGIVMYILTGSIINLLGTKWILVIGLTISGTSAISMYWSASSLMTIIFSSCFVTMGSISSTALLNESVNLFPTTLRTMIVSLTMMFGRIGSLIGNILFPTFMSLGCFPPFLMISLVMFFQDNKKNETPEDPADFETAIASSGFGIFNIVLLLVASIGFGATLFETTTVSYILASAECDLKLTLLDKGILNAITYAGMITSALLWGYIADTQGRKKILVLCYLSDSVCVIGAAMSQNVVQLMIFKYLGGFIVCGPFAVLMSYLSELHGKLYRARVMMLSGMMFSVANLILPVLAITILPQKWNLKFIGLTFHSWHIFLAVSSIPSLVSAISLSTFPESPKFLMSHGRNQEALKIFQSIYEINKRRPRDTYPHKILIEEIPGTSLESRHISVAHTFKEGVAQMLPLLRKPYLKLSLLVYLMNFSILLGQNTIRLWLPQLFASIKEFEIQTAETPIMCAIMEYGINKTANTQRFNGSPCEVVITSSSYTNNIIVSLSSVVMFIFAGSIINAIGAKWILIVGLIIAGTSAISMYWAVSSLTILILSCCFVTFGSISCVTLINESVNLFPTTLRTTVVSLTMMFGRIGSIIGNIIFPIFMTLGCILPFLLLSFVMFAGCFMAIYLPSTKKASLK